MPSSLRLGSVACRDGYGRSGRNIRPPAQGAPFADDLGVKNFGDDRSLGGKLVLEYVEFSWITGTQDGGAIVPSNQAVDLSMIEPGDFAVFFAGFVDLEEPTFHPCAD